jgi:hypothetical protein
VTVAVDPGVRATATLTDPWFSKLAGLAVAIFFPPKKTSGPTTRSLGPRVSGVSGSIKLSCWQLSNSGFPGLPTGPAGVLSSTACRDASGLAVGAELGAVPVAQPAMTAQPSTATRISGCPRMWLSVPTSPRRYRLA